MSTSPGNSRSCFNPFYNRVEVTTWDLVKIVIFSVTIFPFKLLVMAAVLSIAYILCLCGMCGLSFEESQRRPLSKWRRAIRWIIANVVMRAFIFSAGFVWSIKETGKIAKPKEAPIFVVGPHSSYFDATVVILLGAPSVVAKSSTKDLPIFGRLVTFTQAVYVVRESKGSKKNTMEVLKKRAQGVYNGSGMPQIFIYPEGTCGNRSSLINFKVGAFAPQVPVQPVLIRYPNRFDSITWTFDGPPVLRNIWYALAQLYNKIEIEYLPVYVPNQEEKNDPRLYAANVRKYMADALTIPMTNFQIEDGFLMCAMRSSKLVQKLHCIYRAKKALGLSGCSNESTAISNMTRSGEKYEFQFRRFQREFFQVSSEDTTVPEVRAAFSLFKKEEEEEAVDVRQYVFLTCMLYDDTWLRSQDITKILCQIYDLDIETMTEEHFKAVTEAIFDVSEKHHWPTHAGSNSNLQKPIEQSPYIPPDDLRQRLSRYLEFTKLFSDEVTESLSKNYPSREARDKLPNRKLKSE